MNWQQLISNMRLGQEGKHPERHDDRSEFKRDYDRLNLLGTFQTTAKQDTSVPSAGERIRTQPPYTQP